MADNQFRRLPQQGGSGREVATAVNRILDGGINATGSVTLTASAASTVVAERRAGASSVILFMPTTANAAAEIGNATLYVSARATQSFTITHANNSQSDRTFGYVVLG